MKNYFKALAEFQQEVPVIHKGTQGYGYTYADLPAIFETINPLLKNHGLGFTQEMEGTSLKTTVFHVESGEFRESSTDIPQGVTLKGMNDFQVLGSAITYIRRYALSSALGLVTDKDTDAGGEQTKGKDSKIDFWMNEIQFKKSSADAETAQKAIKYFDGKTVQEDGKVYSMKKEYKEQLLKIK
jgi:hypothetical protein